MSIKIEISGETAGEVFAEIAALFADRPFKNPPVAKPLPVEKASPAIEPTVDKPDPAPVSANAGELDAAGWAWNEDMHASTKGKTKDGLWRMKVGVSRPGPKPGFEATTSTVESGAASPSIDPAPTPTVEADDEDEFAAFKAAADKANGLDKEAAAGVPARTYTDADLSALGNQAAQKFGDPGPVKEVITQFVPAGEVVHSRNIPADKRAAFVKAMEDKAGITFAG